MLVSRTRNINALVFLLSFLLASTAYAASVEICGNGIDDPLQTGGSANGTKGSCPAGYMDSVIGNGCDLKCPGVDQDDDGYTSDGTYGTAATTNIDCDDTDRRVFPGNYYPDSWTSPTGYRYCNTNGTWGSTTLNSTTPLCEATGSGVCKYIHCGTGNNSNAGTYASPYLTPGKVSGGATGSPPASPFTLTPGSVVYLLGGTCSTTFSDGTYNVIGEFNADGTSSDWITIKRYPGSTATVTNSDGPVFRIGGDYTQFVDIDGSSQRSTAARASTIWAQYVANMRVSRSYIHDLGGHGDNNDACVMCEHTNGCTVDHSWFEDCDRQTGNVDNIAAITTLDDDNTATECQNHSVKWSTIWQSAVDATNGGQGIKQKHGCKATDVGSNKHPIQYNSIAQVNIALASNGSSMRASDNVISAVPQISRFFNDSENTPNEDNQLTYNTIIDSTLIRWNNIYYSGSPSLTISNNVMRDNDSSYTAGNCDGVISIDCYGSDGNKTTFESGSYLSSDYNCFYNPNTALVFNYYADVGSGAAGANHSFTNWKASVNQDAHSFNEDPSFDSYYRATSSNCSTFGRRYTSSASPTPTPTPTPSPSSVAAFMPYLQ